MNSQRIERSFAIAHAMEYDSEDIDKLRRLWQAVYRDSAEPPPELAELLEAICVRYKIEDGL